MAGEFRVSNNNQLDPLHHRWVDITWHCPSYPELTGYTIGNGEPGGEFEE